MFYFGCYNTFAWYPEYIDCYYYPEYKVEPPPKRLSGRRDDDVGGFQIGRESPNKSPIKSIVLGYVLVVGIEPPVEN